MKILVILALILTGCIRLPQQPKSVLVLMRNPETGQIAECRASLVYFPGAPRVGNAPGSPGGSYYSKQSQDDCIRQYDDLGFVRSDTWRWLQKTSNDTGYTMDHVIATHRRIVAKPPKSESAAGQVKVDEYVRSGEMTYYFLIGAKDCEDKKLSIDDCLKN